MSNLPNVKMQNIVLMHDADGNVLFEDYNNIPKIFHSVLTEKDWEFIRSKQKEINEEAKECLHTDQTPDKQEPTQ